MYYEAANYWIRQRYFGDSNLPPALFKMPGPHEYRVHRKAGSRESKIQMLFRIVFEQHQKKRRLRRRLRGSLWIRRWVRLRKTIRRI